MSDAAFKYEIVPAVPLKQYDKTLPLRPIPYQGQGESVLVVDDTFEVRETMTLMLGMLGYKVSSVANGEEAMDYIRRDKPDILVLDMIMDPGMNGLQTYRMISNIHPSQKAIIVTGYARPEHVREARSLGIGAFLEKPCKIEKIAAAIRHELDRKGE